MTRIRYVVLLTCLVALLSISSCRSDEVPESFDLQVASPVATPLVPASFTEHNPTITIDFETCIPTRGGHGAEQGSTVYEVVGKTDDGCLMNYGGEQENPLWDHFLDNSCVVPFSVGKQKFLLLKVGGVGIDFRPLNPYCKTITRPKKTKDR